MRSRYRINESDAPHFITSTIVEWLPVFTTSACCDVLVRSLAFCRKQKALKIYGWVILDTHFHAILAGPELARTIAEWKQFTAHEVLIQLKQEGREWLLNQLQYFRAAHKNLLSQHQVWQEGVHPQAITSDEMIAAEAGVSA